MISNARNQVMASQSCPATRALASLNSQIPVREYQRKRQTPSVGEASRPSYPKRQRTHFDMTDIISVMEPLEESYCFPAIAWSSDDENSPATHDLRKRTLNSSRDVLLDSGTKDEKAVFKGFHRRASSEFPLGKEARGNSLVRAKSKALCLASLASRSKSSIPPRIEDPSHLAPWEATWASALSSKGRQESSSMLPSLDLALSQVLI